MAFKYQLLMSTYNSYESPSNVGTHPMSVGQLYLQA